MTALSQSLIPVNSLNRYDRNDDDDAEDLSFQEVAMAEIERYRRMDEWMASYHNVYSVTALQCKLRFVEASVVPRPLADFFQYTRPGTYELLRLEAFEALVRLGKLGDEHILEFFLNVLHADPSPFVRAKLREQLGIGLAAVAIGRDRPGGSSGVGHSSDGLIIEGEASAIDARQAELERKQTVPGALDALRDGLGEIEVLKKGLWEAVMYVWTPPCIATWLECRLTLA